VPHHMSLETLELLSDNAQAEPRRISSGLSKGPSRLRAQAVIVGLTPQPGPESIEPRGEDSASAEPYRPGRNIMQLQAIIQATADTPERRAFYEKIDKQNLTALWLSLAELVTPEPRSHCRPASWRFDDIRAYMLEAGGLITTKAIQNNNCYEFVGCRGLIV
jgi:hypothetical protein